MYDNYTRWVMYGEETEKKNDQPKTIIELIDGRVEIIPTQEKLLIG